MQATEIMLPSADELADAVAALQKEKKMRVLYIGLFFIMTILFGYFTYNVLVELYGVFQRHDRLKRLIQKRNARYDILYDGDENPEPVVITDDINYTESIRRAYAGKGDIYTALDGKKKDVTIANASSSLDSNTTTATCEAKPASRSFLYYLFSPLMN